MSLATPFGLGLWPPFDLSGSGAGAVSPSLLAIRPDLAYYWMAAGAATASPALALPYDLAEAIVARFGDLAGTTLAAFTDIYHDAAGNRPTPPYLIFHITAGSTEFLSSSSQWEDTRVRFDAMAGTQKAANAARDAVYAAFDRFSPEFEIGIATPMVRTNRVEAREPGLSTGGKYAFRATVEYQTRIRLN